MAKNLRALKDEELEYINKNYTFEILNFEKNYRSIFDFIKDKLDETTRQELSDMIEHFVKTDGKYIAVTNKNYMKRTVLHDIHEPFLVSTSLRKVSFSKDAINYWINDFNDRYTLPDVQNAISVLTVTYQDVTKDEIRKQLERKTSKVAEV